MAADRVAERARAAAGHPDPRTSLARLAKLGLRNQAAVNRQVRRKLPLDPQFLALTDAIVSESLRRVRLYRPDTDTAPLDRAVRDLRRLRYKHKDAERFGAELRELTPPGTPPAVRTRAPRRRRLPWRPRRENPKVLSRRAASIARGQDAGLRSIRMLQVATQCHIAVTAQQARGEPVDEKLLVVAHGVIVEAMRRGRAFGLSVEVLEEQMAHIEGLSYDLAEAERFAAELSAIADRLRREG